MQMVTFKMQDLTARGTEPVLMILGVDVQREGNTITVFQDGVPHPLNIAEACSGMRMLMAFLALGVAMAYTGLKRWWQRVILVVMGVPTAIVVNIVRVVTLALLALVDANFAAGDFHSFIGLVWLVPAFLIYLGIMWIVRHIVTEEGSAAPARK
jgi:exosortase